MTSPILLILSLQAIELTVAQGLHFADPVLGAVLQVTADKFDISRRSSSIAEALISLPPASKRLTLNSGPSQRTTHDHRSKLDQRDSCHRLRFDDHQECVHRAA